MEGQTARETKAKLFVIDDSSTGLTLAQEILEEAGYMVLTYKSPLGITRELNHHRPDLVLLDVNMPSITGDKICRLIRSVSGAQSPIIILYSSKPVSELRQLSEECGADGFVSKAGAYSDLLFVVKDRLARMKGIGSGSSSGLFRRRTT